MNKIFGGVCLIAGTAIGSGMLALPIILASFGIFYSVLLIISIWLLTYYTSLVSIELNLQAGQGFSLGKLGKLYSGKGAELIGVLSIKIISYALLSVFIYGISSVIQKMIMEFYGYSFSFELIALFSAVSAMLILSLSMHLIDHINRILFYCLLISIATIIFGLLIVIDWNNAPINVTSCTFKDLRLAIPVMFTSFGYQTIFASLVQYFDNDAIKLKKACFWGSLIPTVVYALWFIVILTVIHNHDIDFYTAMANGSVDVSNMILKLSEIANITYMKILVWYLSILAIFTSLIGLGIGLTSAWEDILSKGSSEVNFSVKIQALLLSFIPSLLIAVIVPNAFVKMLSFAGMILVIIAVLLPLYLLQKAQINKLYYYILTSKLIRCIAVLFGLCIITMEVLNIFFKGI